MQLITEKKAQKNKGEKAMEDKNHTSCKRCNRPENIVKINAFGYCNRCDMILSTYCFLRNIE